ncbi:MAG: glutathione S-transferase [Alphaproteobacteria bacterium]|nr:glutathione S-transferase [Alphaproteobacteria bacterium]
MIRIIGRKTSSNVQKVLWLCSEVGLEFERTDLGGPFGGNDKPEYRAMNPNGLVPTIVEDGFVLWESNAIVRYLAAKFAAKSGLYPEDLRERAAGERWMDWQLSVMNPAMRPVFWGYVRTKPEDRDEAALTKQIDTLGAKFRMMDDHLAGHAFMAGDRFTVGDIPVGIAVHRWFEMPIPRIDLPNLARFHARLKERPAFQEHIMQPLE